MMIICCPFFCKTGHARQHEMKTTQNTHSRSCIQTGLKLIIICTLLFSFFFLKFYLKNRLIMYLFNWTSHIQYLDDFRWLSWCFDDLRQRIKCIAKQASNIIIIICDFTHFFAHSNKFSIQSRSQTVCRGPNCEWC